MHYYLWPLNELHYDEFNYDTIILQFSLYKIVRIGYYFRLATFL